MAWLLLFIAGLCEAGWVISLKFAQGFSRLWPSISAITFMIAAVVFLSLSLKSIPIGTAYAIWTGIGTVGTVSFGIVFLREPSNLLKLLCILLILVGVRRPQAA